jgi:hypothetical protein
MLLYSVCISVKCSIEVLFFHTKDGYDNVSVSACIDKVLDKIIVHWENVFIATQVILHNLPPLARQ